MFCIYEHLHVKNINMSACFVVYLVQAVSNSTCCSDVVMSYFLVTIITIIISGYYFSERYMIYV